MGYQFVPSGVNSIAVWVTSYKNGSWSMKIEGSPRERVRKEELRTALWETTTLGDYLEEQLENFPLLVSQKPSSHPWHIPLPNPTINKTYQFHPLSPASVYFSPPPLQKESSVPKLVSSPLNCIPSLIYSSILHILAREIFSKPTMSHTHTLETMASHWLRIKTDSLPWFQVWHGLVSVFPFRLFQSLYPSFLASLNTSHMLYSLFSQNFHCVLRQRHHSPQPLPSPP